MVATSVSACIPTGSAGNLIGSDYKEKLDDLKENFRRAKKSFDLSLRLEIFKAIHGIGEHTASFLCLALALAAIELSTEWSSQLGFLRQELRACEHAHFKPGPGNECLEGTRLDIRADAMQ